jgi:hypothetical protein
MPNLLLEILLLLPFKPPYIHKIQLQLIVPKEYYTTLIHQEVRQNRAKQHHERMARVDIEFVIYPNGKVMVNVACSNKPFKIETDEDESILFSFLGQVRDRSLYHLEDPREHVVPQIMNWYLKGCDINKDIEVSDSIQLSAINIQLKLSDRLFRHYIKSLHEKAVCRAEESLAPNLPLVEALDNIRHPSQLNMHNRR